MQSNERVMADHRRREKDQLLYNYRFYLGRILQTAGRPNAPSPETLELITLRLISDTNPAGRREFYQGKFDGEDDWVIEVDGDGESGEIKMCRQTDSGAVFRYLCMGAGVCEVSFVKINNRNKTVEKYVLSETEKKRSIICYEDGTYREFRSRINYATVDRTGTPIETLDLVVAHNLEPDQSFMEFRTPSTMGHQTVVPAISENGKFWRRSWIVNKRGFPENGGLLRDNHYFTGVYYLTDVPEKEQTNALRLLDWTGWQYAEGDSTTLLLSPEGTNQRIAVCLPSNTLLHESQIDKETLSGFIGTMIRAWQSDPTPERARALAQVLPEVIYRAPMYFTIKRPGHALPPDIITTSQGEPRDQLVLKLGQTNAKNCYPGLYFSCDGSQLVVWGDEDQPGLAYRKTPDPKGLKIGSTDVLGFRLQHTG